MDCDWQTPEKRLEVSFKERAKAIVMLLVATAIVALLLTSEMVFTAVSVVAIALSALLTVVSVGKHASKGPRAYFARIAILVGLILSLVCVIEFALRTDRPLDSSTSFLPWAIQLRDSRLDQALNLASILIATSVALLVVDNTNQE